MERKPGDEGQVILLAGILLVLGFILFSVQLSVLANLGQQVGRETENPLLEDYLLVRRGLDSSLREELRSSVDGVIGCPDLRMYGQRAKAQLDLHVDLEATRGQSMAWDELFVGNVLPTNVTVGVRLRLVDGVTTAQEVVHFSFDCTGAVIEAGCPASGAYLARCRIY